MDNLKKVLDALRSLGLYEKVEEYLKDNEPEIATMKLLGQRDPKWANVKIANSTSSLYYYGCTSTCISMLSSWYGCFKDPAWLAKNLRFSYDLVLWQSIAEKMCFKWIWRQYGRDEAKIDASLAGKSTSCILQINKGHWVVAIRKDGNNYRIADPWYPSYRWIDKKLITGSAHFDVK